MSPSVSPHNPEARRSGSTVTVWFFVVFIFGLFVFVPLWNGHRPSMERQDPVHPGRRIAAGAVWRGLKGLPHAKSSHIMALLRETTGRSMRRKAVSILGRHIGTGSEWRKLILLDHAKEVGAGG